MSLLLPQHPHTRLTPGTPAAKCAQLLLLAVAGRLPASQASPQAPSCYACTFQGNFSSSSVTTSSSPCLCCAQHGTSCGSAPCAIGVHGCCSRAALHSNTCLTQPTPQLREVDVGLSRAASFPHSHRPADGLGLAGAAARRSPRPLRQCGQGLAPHCRPELDATASLLAAWPSRVSIVGGGSATRNPQPSRCPPAGSHAGEPLQLPTRLSQRSCLACRGIAARDLRLQAALVRRAGLVAKVDPGTVGRCRH